MTGRGAIVMSQRSRQWTASPKQLAILGVAFVVLFCFTAVVSRTIVLVNLKQQEAATLRSIDALNQQIADKQDEIKYLESASYLEKAARTILMWGRQGERILIGAASGATSPPAGGR
jgi:cell division protein FtsB